MFEVNSPTRKAVADSLAAMPMLASNLIHQYHDMRNSVNKKFAENPDNPAMHEFHWHQFGIVTHCRRFQEYLERVVPPYLHEWGIAEMAHRVLKQEIDGVAKWQLLQLVAVWHDIGKFTARQPYNSAGDYVGFSFKGHENDSGKLIRNELYSFFKQMHFSEAQIEYIAHCAELHFELGKLRRKAKPHYTLAFARSSDATAGIQHILHTYADYALEIGLCFLADSLSKVEVYATAKRTSEIEAQKSKLQAALAAKNLPDTLLSAALQMPVNVKITENYLKKWQAERANNGILWLQLDQKSVALLRQYTPPRFAQSYYHHVTLIFDTPQKNIAEYVGQTAEAYAYAEAYNDHVQAVRVRNADLPNQYGVLHVTLSARPGIEPFASVAMLKSQHHELVLPQELKLTGTLEFVQL